MIQQTTNLTQQLNFQRAAQAARNKFRTPLRNVALQAAFFHNGCFTRLDWSN